VCESKLNLLKGREAAQLWAGSGDERFSAIFEGVEVWSYLQSKLQILRRKMSNFLRFSARKIWKRP
jgi:hypothetical protein